MRRGYENICQELLNGLLGFSWFVLRGGFEQDWIRTIRWLPLLGLPGPGGLDTRECGWVAVSQWERGQLSSPPSPLFAPDVWTLHRYDGAGKIFWFSRGVELVWRDTNAMNPGRRRTSLRPRTSSPLARTSCHLPLLCRQRSKLSAQETTTLGCSLFRPGTLEQGEREPSR